MKVNQIYNEDCLVGMQRLPDNSIDLVLTDPPYGISFMNKKWDYEIPSVEIWQECIRVLKPGGHLLAFAGTRTQHRMAVNIEDAGFEIRDTIIWLYGSGFPKSLNIGKAVDKLQGGTREVVGQDQSGSNRNCMAGDFTGGKYDLTKGTSEWEGWGTALKPAYEPITLARKPLSEKTIAENVLKWGTGGLNIDECRVSLSGNENLGAVQNGNIYGSKGIQKTVTPTYKKSGRFPANIIHDGSDEVLAGFPDTTSGKLLTHHKRNNSKSWFTGDEIKGSYGDSGSAARYFYCAKASKTERSEGNNHPTVKPLVLIQYLLKLASKENYVVLDPFLGSGTTAVACIQNNRNYIGFEIDEGYFSIAKQRIKAAEIQMTLL